MTLSTLPKKVSYDQREVSFIPHLRTLVTLVTLVTHKPDIPCSDALSFLHHPITGDLDMRLKRVDGFRVGVSET